MVWDAQLEARCTETISALCGAEDDVSRIRHWQQLVLAVSPHIETWAGRSPVLRAWRLDNVDDVRTVLVRVLSRLQQGGYANLQRFRARQVHTDAGQQRKNRHEEDRAELRLAAREV